MGHAYAQGSYIAAPYSFESAKNQETEQIRPLAGIATYYQFSAGTFDANETYAWTMPADVLIESFWVQYPGAPGGLVTVTLFNPLGIQQNNLIFNINNNGEKFDNAWSYLFRAPFAIPKGWQARFRPSVPISSVVAYGEPCLFLNGLAGVRVS